MTYNHADPDENATDLKANMECAVRKISKLYLEEAKEMLVLFPKEKTHLKYWARIPEEPRDGQTYWSRKELEDNLKNATDWAADEQVRYTRAR